MKKMSANWYIAATHYLTAAFVPGILVGAGVVILSYVFFSNNDLYAFVARAAVPPLAAWLGVMYSTDYLEKKYILINAERIVVFSTIYYVVVNIVVLGGVGYWYFRMLDDPQALLYYGILMCGNVLGLVVFYLASAESIHDDPPAADPIRSAMSSALFPESYAPPPKHSALLDGPQNP